MCDIVDLLTEIADSDKGWEDENGKPLDVKASRFILDMKRILALCCVLVDNHNVQLTANEKALLETYYKLWHMPKQEVKGGG
jgi:hypothetical protein